MLNMPFAPGVGKDRFIPKSSKNVDGRPLPPSSRFPETVVVFSSFGAFFALFESSLTLFLAFFKRRSMAAMESSSSSDSSSPVDDDAASILMRIVVPFFVRVEDEEKAEETRLCASRDNREDARANIIRVAEGVPRRRRTKSFI